MLIEDCYFHDSLLQHYEDYPKRKIGLGICLFTHEWKTRSSADITIKNCEFRRLASASGPTARTTSTRRPTTSGTSPTWCSKAATFEEGKQWPMGLRGWPAGRCADCVTHDIGRDNLAFNGVAGAMFHAARTLSSRIASGGASPSVQPGKVSGDGQAFDFEVKQPEHVMRRCLFHDTDGPGFLLCNGASGPGPELDILLGEMRFQRQSDAGAENGYPKVEIMNFDADINQRHLQGVPFLPERRRKTDQPDAAGLTFTDCFVKPLVEGCSTANLALKPPGHPPRRAVSGHGPAAASLTATLTHRLAGRKAARASGCNSISPARRRSMNSGSARKRPLPSPAM